METNMAIRDLEAELCDVSLWGHPLFTLHTRRRQQQRDEESLLNA